VKYTVDFEAPDLAVEIECFESRTAAEEFAFLKTLSGASPRIFRHRGTDPADGDDLWEQIQ